MLTVSTIAIAALFVACALADVDDVEATTTYPKVWLSRYLHTEAGCAANTDYEIFEEPFDTCVKYLPDNSTNEESYLYKGYNSAAGTYKQCIYTDTKCTVAEQCRDITTACAKVDLGAGNMAYVTTTVGAPTTLGKPSMFGLWKYNLYGGVMCNSDGIVMDESFELSIGQCVKFTMFHEWNDVQARYCAYFDAKCQDDFPYQCTVVRLGKCIKTGKGQSYNSTVQYVKMQNSTASALSMSAVTMSAIVGAGVLLA